MANKIATVRLSPGQVGYYDDLSHIHLTIGRPEGYVLAGMNCSQLRRSVKAGTITVVEGSLGENSQPYKLIKKNGKFVLSANKGTKSKPDSQKKIEPIKTEPIKVEPAKEEKTEEIEKPVIVKEEEKAEIVSTIDESAAPIEKTITENDEEKPKKKTTKKSTKSKKAAE